MRDLEVPDDRPAPAAPPGEAGAGGSDQEREPALARLAGPRRRPSAVLALLALRDLPTAPAAAEPAAAAEPDAGHALPRRRPADPVAGAPPPAGARTGALVGPRPAVLDRVWAHDVDTLRRIAVLLRAM